MNTFMRKFGTAAIATTLSLLALPALADGSAEKILLADGASLYILADGSMRMVDPLGQSMRMRDGEIMITEGGDAILMINPKTSTPRHQHKRPGGQR